MSAHPREHEELVERILEGELDADDPTVRARLAGCPDCRSELDRLRALHGELRAAMRQERQDLDEARASAMPADEALVRRSLAAALAVGGASRRPRPILGLVGLAAGLLALLGLGLFLHRMRAVAAPEVLLHGGTLACDAPVGEVEGYDEFSWNGPLPPGGRFELRIHALEDGRAGALLQSIPCLERRWIPGPEEERALPDAIYWEVVALDVAELAVERGWAVASRRSR